MCFCRHRTTLSALPGERGVSECISDFGFQRQSLAKKRIVLLTCHSGHGTGAVRTLECIFIYHRHSFSRNYETDEGQRNPQVRQQLCQEKLISAVAEPFSTLSTHQQVRS
jgi:hypothetical protein